MRVVLTVVQGRSAPQILEVDSSSVLDARERTAARGFTVLSAKSSGSSWRDWSARSTQRIDLPLFIAQLRDLLTAGLSVIEALGALRRGAKGMSVPVIETLERQLREGRPLSGAMAAMPVFPALLIALVRASELTSDLPQSLTRFLEHEQRATEVRHRITSVSIYPMLLTAVGTMVLLFLVFYVVPRFARIFDGMSGELPWSATLMVAWAQLLRAHGAWLGAGATGFVVAFGAAAASRTVRAGLMQRLLSWAPLREQFRLYFLARWYHATGMLVQGGIPLSQALSLTSALLPLTLNAHGLRVEDSIKNGLSPSAAYMQAGMATPVAEQLLLAGERSGELGSVLGRIARYHEEEVSRTLERGMRIFEPVVMVLIGLSVGVVVVLMYMPIFELASAIN